MVLPKFLSQGGRFRHYFNYSTSNPTWSTTRVTFPTAYKYVNFYSSGELSRGVEDVKLIKTAENYTNNTFDFVAFTDNKSLLAQGVLVCYTTYGV